MSSTTLTVLSVVLALVVIGVLAAALIVIRVKLVSTSRTLATLADALSGIGQINDSGVRILHSARALRKVAVGK